MKLAILSHTHPSISKGGAEIAAYTLFQGLYQRGVDVVFIAACDYAFGDKLVLSKNEFALYYDASLYDHFYNIASPSMVKDLWSTLAELNVSIVNFHHFLYFGYNGIERVLQQPNIKCILTLHEFGAICANHGQMVTRPSRLLCYEASPKSCSTCFPEKSERKFVVRTEQFMRSLKGMAGFVSPSNFLAKRFIDWGLPGHLITVIENGLGEVGTTDVAADLPPSSSWVFGYFGQINPFKGVDVLLDAVEILAKKPAGNSIKFRIHGNLIGQTSKFNERFSQLTTENHAVSYFGPYNNQSVLKLMGQCNYIIVPSTWWENSPVVIQEAFAAERPLICSNIGGMAEKINTSGAGLQFRVSEPEDLAEKIIESCDTTLYTKLKARIPKVYSSIEMADKYLEFIYRLQDNRQ